MRMWKKRLAKKKKKAAAKKPEYLVSGCDIRLDQSIVMSTLNQFTNEELDNVRHHLLNDKLATGEYYEAEQDVPVHILDSFISPALLHSEYPIDHVEDIANEQGYCRESRVFDGDEDEVVSHFPYLEAGAITDILDYITNGRILGTIKRTLLPEHTYVDEMPALITDQIENRNRIHNQLTFLEAKGVVPEELDWADYGAVDRWAARKLCDLFDIRSVIAYPNLVVCKRKDLYGIDRLDMLAIKHYYPTTLMEKEVCIS